MLQEIGKNYRHEYPVRKNGKNVSLELDVSAKTRFQDQSVKARRLHHTPPLPMLIRTFIHISHSGIDV